MSEIESPSTPVSPAPDSVLPASEPAAVTGGDPAMAELLELFDGPLRGVSFPDVSRDALRALAGEVEASQAERDGQAAMLAEAEEVLAEAEAAVAAARAALRDAEAVVDERQRGLLARGQRALSYAKVFAETDPGLHAQLSAISLSRIAQRGRGVASTREPRPRSAEPTVAVAPRKRGRPAKQQPVEASVSS